MYAELKLYSDGHRIRKIYIIAAIPAVVTLISIIVNFFVPIIFSVSDKNIYSREWLYAIPAVSSYFYILLGTADIYINKDKVKKYLFLPALLFVMPLILGSIIQTIFYGISLIWLCAAIGLASLYINLQNEVSSTDSLSGLYTRQYATKHIETLVKKALPTDIILGIMLDIDKFKKINDTYGHLEGDQAITAAGQILRTSISSKAFAARYAGDEFIVISEVESEKDIPEVINAIKKETEKYNDSNTKPYKIEFSLGYSTYNMKENSIDTFLRKMDEAMYKDKNERRSTAGN